MIPFVQARHFTTASRGRDDIDLLVIHDMESPERLDTAENVARWFAGPTAPQASAHYNVDADSIVQSVREKDVAWHAPGGNHNGIGVEHAGVAQQTAAEWDDPYSRAMLARSAGLGAAIVDRYDLPIVYLRAADLLAGKRGITTHWQVSLAFRRSSHTDPGPNFPIERYLASVRAAAGQPTTPPPRPVKQPEPVLRLGATGWRVKQAQRLLRFAGDKTVREDGMFGSATLAAVKRFQLRAGLTPDGVVGANTWRALWQSRYVPVGTAT